MLAPIMVRMANGNVRIKELEAVMPIVRIAIRLASPSAMASAPHSVIHPWGCFFMICFIG